MAIEVKKNWVQTDDGDWVNFDHIDLLEVKQDAKSEKWQIVAWNALQPQVEAYVLSNCKSETDARKSATKLVDLLIANS